MAANLNQMTVSRQYLNGILQSMGDMLLVTDNSFVILQVNQAVLRQLKFKEEELIGSHINKISLSHRVSDIAACCAGDNGDAAEYQEVICSGPDGKQVYGQFSVSRVRDHNSFEQYIFLGTDISCLKQVERKLSHLAHYDALTQLPNRSLMLDRLQLSLATAHRHNRRVTVVFIDLDRFKYVNDSLGHDAGDLLLKTVAQRLTECIRKTDTASRLGGDEFVLLLEDQANEDSTFHCIERILNYISEPIELNGHALNVTCSIGCSIFPEDGEDAGTLLKRADAAMYKAKEIGRANYQFFTPEIQDKIDKRVMLEAELRCAIEKDEFELYYQPQVDIRTGCIVGVEALIRWQHSQKGLISPAEFIPLAEESGLIMQLGRWVMLEACRQNRQWQVEGLPVVPISVNVSNIQLAQEDMYQTVFDCLHETGLQPELLKFEVTESSIMQGKESIHQLQKIRKSGVLVSLDDFGTGYSSLSALRGLPIDELKIDKSFISDLASGDDGRAIVSAIIAMAKQLHLDIVAEGVETSAELEFLRENKVDIIQGYYFSKPLAAEMLKQTYLLSDADLQPDTNPDYYGPLLSNGRY